MKHGGSVRIVLPCMDKAMLNYKNKKFEKFNNFFYATNDDSFHSHRYAYNFDFLSQILKDIGFDDILKSEFLSKDFKDAKFLDNRETYYA